MFSEGPTLRSYKRELEPEPGLHGTDGETIESEGSMRQAIKTSSVQAEDR